MEPINIRKKLHHFIDNLDDKKAEAIYTLFEEEIETIEWEYTNAFKTELEERYQYYKDGGKTISAAEAGEQINKIL